MRSYLTSPDGTEQTVGFYLPGELVGLDGLQDELHTCATVALETSSVWQVPCAQLKQLCAKLPGLQRQMMRLVGKEVSSDHEALLLLGSRTAEERLATFLLSLSRRYRARGFSETDFNLSMSRHDIANYLGTAVETVSRQFASLQKQGVLRVNQRRVHISDLNRLRSMVEPCVNHRSYSSL
jgi:CRP/FNR family transcriptional regulator